MRDGHWTKFSETTKRSNKHLSDNLADTYALSHTHNSAQ